MKYTKSLTGGILAAIVAGVAYFVIGVVNSFKASELGWGGYYSVELPIGMLGSRGFLLLALAFFAGFLGTLIITSRHDA